MWLNAEIQNKASESKLIPHIRSWKASIFTITQLPISSSWLSFFIHLNQAFWILLYLNLPKIVGKKGGGNHRNGVTVYNFSGILYFIKYITSHPWNCNIKKKLILHYFLQYKLISTFNLNFYCKPTPCQCIE